MMNRSKVVLAAALAVLACIGARTTAQNASQRPRAPRLPQIGVQLYSVRDDCAKDLPGVLKAVAKMGYAGVEFAGYYGRSAEELRKMLDENGLKCCGTHTGLDTLLGDNLAKTIAFNKTLGNRYLIVPGLPEERTRDKAAWLETARLFNEISEKLRAENMYIGYHSHAGDFKKIDDTTGWDLFFSNTNSRVVMQLDFGNTKSAGVDPIQYLEKYPGRQRTVHIKEYSHSNPNALLGEGDIDWNRALTLLKTRGRTQWLIVEAESSATTPLDCIEKNLTNLKALVAKVYATR